MAISLTPKEAMLQLQNTNHFIEKDKAVTMIRRFTTHRSRLFKTDKRFTTLPFNVPALPNCLTYNKDAISALVNVPDSVAIRIYPAINDDNNLTFVLVAVNEAGENITWKVDSGTGAKLLQSATVKGYVDEGQVNPPYPVASVI